MAIIDDDKPSAKLLAKRLAERGEEVAGMAHTAKDGYLMLLKARPQLLFLDIELPDMSGLEFATSMLEEADWNMRIIFYTSYEKYLLQALRAKAFDFLLKPLNDDELSLVLSRFRHEKSEPPKAAQAPTLPRETEKPLIINTITNDKMVVRPHNIGYFRFNSDRKLWEVVTDNLRSVILKHNTTADIILGYRNEFTQIHKSFIINISFLKLIQDNTCLLLPPFEDVQELKISKVYKKQLLDRFYDL